MTDARDADAGSIRVAALSPEIVVGDVDGNLERIREAISAAARREAQLIVLPELATSGYVFGDREEALTASLSAADPRWRALQGESQFTFHQGALVKEVRLWDDIALRAQIAGMRGDEPVGPGNIY